MSTHNICFSLEIRKIIFDYTLLSACMYNTVITVLCSKVRLLIIVRLSSENDLGAFAVVFLINIEYILFQVPTKNMYVFLENRKKLETTF